MPNPSTALRNALSRAHPAVFTVVAGAAGFFAYFAMYAFRKPFSAATFEGPPGWHFPLDYKIALVLAQVAGYAQRLAGMGVMGEGGQLHRGPAPGLGTGRRLRDRDRRQRARDGHGPRE